MATPSTQFPEPTTLEDLEELEEERHAIALRLLRDQRGGKAPDDIMLAAATAVGQPWVSAA